MNTAATVAMAALAYVLAIIHIARGRHMTVGVIVGAVMIVITGSTAYVLATRLGTGGVAIMAILMIGFTAISVAYHPPNRRST